VIDIGTHTKHRDRDFKFLIGKKYLSYRHRIEFVAMHSFISWFDLDFK